MDYILGSKQKDWTFIILSPLAGFAIVGLYLFLIHIAGLEVSTASLITFGLFAVLFDVRHFFPTYTRTLLDKDFMKENRRWFTLSWLFILFIPVLLVALLSSSQYRAFDSYVLFTIFIRFTYIMGFYHLIKQNWGFIAIYKKKRGESSDSDFWEKSLLLSGSFIPFIYISIIYPVWFEGGNYAFAPEANQLDYIIALWDKLSLAILLLGLILLAVGFSKSSRAQYKFTGRNIAFSLIGIFVLYQLIKTNSAQHILLGALVITSLIFLVSLIQTIRFQLKNKTKNPEKWMVLIGTLLLYAIIIPLPIENKFVMVMGITLPHNIQYLAFTKVFAKKYYGSSQRDHGLARVFMEKTGLFVVISIIYAIVFESMRTGVRFLPIDPSNEALQYARNLFSVFFLGMVMHHYYLDAIIWRVRKDTELSKSV